MAELLNAIYALEATTARLTARYDKTLVTACLSKQRIIVLAW
jgi:hypothetical protein